VASVNDGRKHHMKIARVRIRKPKEFKRIAMRSDKTDQSFAAMIYISAAVINSR
jgi:hypothetical protein